MSDTRGRLEHGHHLQPQPGRLEAQPGQGAPGEDSHGEDMGFLKSLTDAAYK